MSSPKKYTLTLHKKSYLLKGITKDDPNKDAVKSAEGKWNGALGGWLFFPKNHEKGLKLAKKIGAKIEIEESKEKEEVKEDEKGDDDKYKKKYKKLKKEMKENCFKFAQLVLSQIDSFDGMDDDTLENLWDKMNE